MDFHINMGRTYRHNKDEDWRSTNRKRLRKNRRTNKLKMNKSYNKGEAQSQGTDEDSNFEKFSDKKDR